MTTLLDLLALQLGLSAPPDICSWPVISRICEAINNFGNLHLPLDDIDNDGFSPIHTFRGADWRGKDCDDTDTNVRPGRKAMDGDINVDSNCNGIYGVDPTTNTPYEELFCKDTPQYGTVVLGDSASAHFHVPPQVQREGQAVTVTVIGLASMACC